MYGRNHVNHLYVCVHCGYFYHSGMADQLYDTLYSGKEEPGVCGLFVIGNEERTNCKSLHERKSFSWRVCAIHGIPFRKLVTAGVIFHFL